MIGGINYRGRIKLEILEPERPIENYLIIKFTACDDPANLEISIQFMVGYPSISPQIQKLDGEVFRDSICEENAKQEIEGKCFTY
jgi:hypothetical protein